MVTGIICEYNPLHLGHKKQLDQIKSQGDAVVCLMSGSYVQRGMPAIIDKMTRAKAAIACGADLVLELPLTACVSSAEGFADTGVRILSGFCHRLSFGAEHSDPEALVKVAAALLRPDFPQALRGELDKGISFPAARQAALASMGVDARLLTLPNNILAVEYCKAILSQNASMQPCPISRPGNYHDTTADPENPSATALRQRAEAGLPWLDFVPPQARELFAGAPIHTLSAGEQMILAKLRVMTDAEFEALPYGNEGLWRKLMKNARTMTSLEQILTATKSKRYTRTRLDRMVLCALLGITGQDMERPSPYTRVLAFNDTGRQILKQARETGAFVHVGEIADDPYQMLENRAEDLYGLFSLGQPEAPGQTGKMRVYYQK